MQKMSGGDVMTNTSNKLRINISAKILLLVLSLAILLASFGGYSVYVINSIGLKIERLNQIESVLETRINNMNSARIESANMASTSAFTLILAGMNATNDQVTAFNKTVQNANVKMEEGLAELQRKTTPGNPLTWRTSDTFLDHFGLKGISDLPGIDDLKNSGLLEKDNVIFKVEPTE